MKSLIIISVLVFANFAMAKNYNCSYDDDGKLKQIKVKIDKSSGALNFRGKDYKNCKVEKDEFGQLVDCSSLELDFMVLINETEDSTSGGIMSSSFDLFVDLEC